MSNSSTLDLPEAPHHEAPSGKPKKRSATFNADMVRRAVLDSFIKLSPRHMKSNPVMFVVELGSVLTTFYLIRDFGSSSSSENVFALSVVVWLWFTVLFANFAEAVAEGRGKAQAETLRRPGPRPSPTSSGATTWWRWRRASSSSATCAWWRPGS